MSRYRLTFIVDLTGDHEVADGDAATEKGRELYEAFSAAMADLDRPGLLLPVVDVASHPHARPIPAPGDYVRHVHSNWSGTVLEVGDGTGPDALVTVRPTHPRPKEVRAPAGDGFVPTPDDWPGWNPITVCAGELVVER